MKPTIRKAGDYWVLIYLHADCCEDGIPVEEHYRKWRDAVIGLCVQRLRGKVVRQA